MSDFIESSSDEVSEKTEDTISQDAEDTLERTGFAFDSLEAIRKKLLDLSGRNKLLSYRHPKASCIRIIDELPDQIYNVLSSGKSFIFIPVPEPTTKELREKGYILIDENGREEVLQDYPTAEQWAKELGFDTNYDLPDASVDENGEMKHNDTNLQTLLYAPELESRLRSIRRKSETAIEESGSNILYLAIGFLERYESRDSDIKRLAPLFTLPVQLERSKLDSALGVYRYKLTLKDEGLLTNITLREKLGNDFDLILPEIDDDLSPELYFKQINDTIIQHQPRWKIRRQVSLVLLDFSKQAMYQDLDPDNWPENAKLENHPVIQMFFNSSSVEGAGESSSYESEHEIDHVQDIHTQFPIIYDADSSQHSALIDAVNGENIVIEGPPGTGKSQTITNLIAACIANGKKVLFVAEKMAALNVVKNRLDKAGLGDFCLEVHSHKTHKLKILQELMARHNNQNKYRTPGKINDDIERHEDLKGKLLSYVETINSQWKLTGLTIHQILNKATRYREQYGLNPENLKITGIDGESFTTVKQKEMLDKADMLALIYDQVSEQANEGLIVNHFWYGVQNSQLKGYQIDELNTFLKNWMTTLKQLNDYWSGFIEKHHLDIIPDTKLWSIQSFIVALSNLPDLQGGELLANINSITQNHEAFNNMLHEYQYIHAEINEISKTIKIDSVNKSTALDALEKALTGFNKLGVKRDNTLKIISDDVTELVRIDVLLGEANKQFEQIRTNVPDALKKCFNLSRDGFDEFIILIGLINSLPQELWRHRDDLFDNPDLDDLLAQLTQRLRDLTPKHQEIIEYFSIHRLPDSEMLRKYYSHIENAGFFKIFSSEWRKARRLILALSSKPKPDKKQLLSLLPTLIDYKSGIEQVDKLNKDDPVLDKYYKGIDTPLERIVELRKWYQSVRGQYGRGFGERVEMGDALLGIDRNMAIAVADIAHQGLSKTVEDLNRSIGEVTKRYSAHILSQDKNASYYGADGVVNNIKDNIDHNVNLLELCVSDKNVSLEVIQVHHEKLISLHKKIALWKDTEAVKYFTPGILPLNEMAGEFSQNQLEAGLNTAKISAVLIDNAALLNAIAHEPTIHSYNDIRSKLPDLHKLDASMWESAKKFFDLGNVNYSEWSESSEGAIQSLIERNNCAIDNPIWLNTWVDYIRIKEKLCSKGLDKIIQNLESENIATKDLKNIVDLVVHHQLAEEIFDNHEKLSNFSGLEQMAVRKKYQEYDRKLMELQREKIAFQASRGETTKGAFTGKVSNYTEMSLIKHEAGKKSRHIAVRKLFTQSSKSIQALKPCFMMSPMSVAQYLEPGKFDFDLVVMDEASQIRPEDAIGSIRRGKRLVVVGDPKQLPPTSFFIKTINEDEDADNIGLEDSESILDSVIPMFKSRRLRWHYRSRHESLIAFSNKHFYDGDLIIFPSPFQESDEFGVNFTRVKKGRFHTRRNVEEAREVVQAATLHLEQHPDESIGIVAMSSEQRDEIERQMEQYIKDDMLLSKAYENNLNSDEPLFIKNLENVQGDERDVILISMTYGPENIGGRIMQRFGPINSNVGWRRLNVLFTRSKKRMHIFSSMGSADILVKQTSSKGVQSLRHFLEYCETGHLHHIKHTGRPPDSDFEVAVMRTLSEYGYECEPQLGVAGYYLDLAVRDPGNPGHFLMGIECDGATYHSAKSTRDRDRLRQDILESLGWKIRRIWSTDWFKNPQAQLYPIVQELERIKTTVSDEVLSEVCEQSSTYTITDGIDSKDSLLIENVGEQKNEISLLERLQEFDQSVIQKQYPDTDDNRRLLRDSMIEAILHHLPCSKSEFLELIPGYLRSGTESNEAKQFLEPVLEIVADYG